MDSASYPVTATVVFTLGTASRTVLYMIYYYKKNEEKKLSSLYWKKFRENLSLYGKQDSLASSYFLLLFIDYRIFHYLGGRIGYTLMYTTLFLLLLSAVLFKSCFNWKIKKKSLGLQHFSCFLMILKVHFSI